MKALDEIKVSVYENVYSKKPKVMSFLEVVTMCIHPTYASTINTVRGYFMNGEHEAAQKIKSGLPCFTPAGTFDGAHAIKRFLEPSHIIGLDYDHVPNRGEIIKACAADPHTVAALESPTDGVKVFAYVDDVEGRHREAQQQVSKYYDQLLGLKSDPACKDESRLCYFTYSPNGYVAALYEAFALPEVASVAAAPASTVIPASTAALAAPSSSAAPSSPVASGETSDVSEEEIEQFLTSYIFLYPLVPGQRHTHLFRLACEAARRRYPQKSILRGIAHQFEGTNFTLDEIKSVLTSGYQQVNSSSPSAVSSPASASQKDKRTKVPFVPLENDNDQEDAFWEGEEYRKQTPCFPKDLYDNLPDLLDECISDHYSNREKDISLLSVLTALSAALPNTYGIYNHKKYTPHIFCLITAPSANSKSTGEIGRYLLQSIQQHILSESESRQKAFHQMHNQWKLDFARLKKTGGKCPEEPEEPVFKTLFIPATTSYTRMLMHIRDNAAQGSIIFDTEADTYTNANKMDCGNFENILRKSFEHEELNSSYKVNGIIPINIQYPRLALFLTGTPGQLQALLSSTENGMTSRIIIYTFREMARWKDMGDSSTTTEDYLQPLKDKTLRLYQFCENHPMLFHFTRAQWDKFNHMFSNLLASVALEGNDNLQSVVKRYAFLVMRLSMIQTRIRQFEKNDASPEVYCDDVDFERSCKIILNCYEHSRLVLSSLPSSTHLPLKNPNQIRDFIDHLPDTFTTEEAVLIGVNYEFNRRKVTRLLKSLIGLEINKISHGNYSRRK